MSQFIIKDLPSAERPRERFLMNGASSVSLEELLAIILEQGNVNNSVVKISRTLVENLGGAIGLSEATYEELIEIKGIGSAKAIKLLASFELARRLIVEKSLVKKGESLTSSRKVFEVLKPYFYNLHQEQFIMISLDARKKLIGIDKLSLGTINQCLIHPREVFRTAINRRATSIIISHNHPSNSAIPSEDDINITKRLYTASRTIGIMITDHIVTCDNEYYSFKDNNLLDFDSII